MSLSLMALNANITLPGFSFAAFARFVTWLGSAEENSRYAISSDTGIRHDDSGLPTPRRVPLDLSVAARAAGDGLRTASGDSDFKLMI